MFLSVIIPTYNRLPILQKCVKAITEQTWTEDLGLKGYEVIIVDDGSTDGTLAWLQVTAASLPHLKCLQQEHCGPAAARNLGLQHAQGEWIIFIDSDLVVTAGFIEAHLRRLLEEKRTFGHC